MGVEGGTMHKKVIICKHKKVGVAILVSDKIDLKMRNITKVKEGHFIMIKELIRLRDMTMIYICT